MISAEAPVLFAKAAEMFIHELTMRAWIHTEVFFLSFFIVSHIRHVRYRYLTSCINWLNIRTTKGERFREMTLLWQSPNTTSSTSSLTLCPGTASTGFNFGQRPLCPPSWKITFLCRDDIKPTTKREESSVRMVPDQVNVLQLCFIHIYICSIDFIIRVAWPVINVQVSYYFQLAQQHQQQLQQNSGSPTQAQQVQFFLPIKYQISVNVKRQL